MTRADLALVMPMAGRGSRFSRGGRTEPKPLIDIGGRPAFWWATESVRTAGDVRELVYVVLAEHVARFAIDEVVRSYYPDARVVAIPDVTAGAAETAAIGVAALESTGPIAINDCDHAFGTTGLRELTARLMASVDGALLGFRSSSPNYSYAAIDGEGRVLRTVEKSPISPFAIAGCYLFNSGGAFVDALARYRTECAYPELYMSGVYDVLIRRGAQIVFHELAAHVAFGTPEELQRTDPDQLARLLEHAP